MRRGVTVFECEVLDERPGFLTAIFRGESAYKTFQNEAGGHRWQRNPPTEKGSRVHTSTVTVAVLRLSQQSGGLNLREVEFAYTRGSGPGGQHRNKTESCVIATHRPSGAKVRIDMRSQHQSKAMAIRVLESRLLEIQCERRNSHENQTRKTQIGSGMRGDKVRTYRSQDNQITDHRTGQKFRLDRWLRGEWQT